LRPLTPPGHSAVGGLFSERRRLMRRFQSQWLAWLAVALAIAAFTASAWGQRPARETPKGTRIKGHIVRVQGPDRFVVRTADKREVILHTHPETRFLLNDRVVRFTDLREGAEIDAVFDVVEERNLVNSVTITSAEAIEEFPAPKIIEGTIVRMLEADNQFVVRTMTGEEVVVVAEERTAFTIDDRPVRLVDFRPGAVVRVNCDVRNQKHIARSVAGIPKRHR
jgi:hypothetical protein